MSNFLNDDFLLSTPQARELYHTYAAQMPIFDFHCHINPTEVADNKPYSGITELWLGGDHYKWRAMRINGAPEDAITGKSDDFTRFQAWAETIENAIGNPLYHWTHLELKRYFDIDYPLTGSNAKLIYDECNERLKTPDFLPQNILVRSNVKAFCTTDDPADDLSAHIRLSAQNTDCRMLPTFRPDKACALQKPGYAAYIDRLGKSANVSITDFTGLCDALLKRAEFFAANGCKAADFSFEVPQFSPVNEAEADRIFKAALNGESISYADCVGFTSTILVFLGRIYQKLGFVMQLHVGALRNANSALLASKGPDIGFDTVDDGNYVHAVAGLLDTLNRQECLPKTVLYNLNAKDTQAFAALAATFCGGGITGRVQYGAAWWFLDTLVGNTAQLKTLAGLHLLPRFIGMLTDSRSLLSYTRHEYFRRVLCGMLGEWADGGLIPDDSESLGKIVQNISFGNAWSFFDM